MKKFLALLISLSMLIMCVPGISLVASAAEIDDETFLTITDISAYETEVIDGATYYLIDSADKFRAVFDEDGKLGMGSTDNRNFKLTKDITLAWKSGKGYAPRYNISNTAYSGIFDGGNNTVTLDIGDSSTRFNIGTGNYRKSGLFGYLKGTVKNLTLDGTMYVTGGSYGPGAFAGEARSAKFSNCTNKVKINYNGNKDKTGGYVGVSRVIEFTNCTFDGEIVVTGGSKIGGFVGQTESGNPTFNNCVNYADIPAASEAGGILGAINTGYTATFNNCANYGDGTSGGGILGAPLGANVTAIFNGCLNAGNLTGGGALMGSAASGASTGITININNCYNAGEANGAGDYPGSFIGRSNGTSGAEITVSITNSYTIGSTGREFVNGVGNSGAAANPVVFNVTASGNYVLGNDRRDAQGATGGFLKTVPANWSTDVWELPTAGYPYIQLKANKIDITNANVAAIVEDTAAYVATGVNFATTADAEDAAKLANVKDASGAVTPIAEGTKYAIVVAKIAAMAGGVDYEYGIVIDDEKYAEAVRNVGGTFAVLVYNAEPGEYTYKPYVKVDGEYYYGAQRTFVIAE